MTTTKRIDYLFEKQKKFFQTGKTLPVEFRIAMLKKLKACVIRHEKEIATALKADLGKS